MERLGYGLAPVALYLAATVFVASSGFAALRRTWRPWVAAGLLVAICLGIMSMFVGSGWVTADASLGGHWGQRVGGSPMALGALKIAVLFLLVPLFLFPRRTWAIYSRIAVRLLRALAGSMRWVAERTAHEARELAARLSPDSRGAHGMGRLLRKASISSRRSWRSVFGAPQHAAPPPGPPKPAKPARKKGRSPNESEVPRDDGARDDGWHLPSLELLGKGEARPVSQAVLQGMAKHIEDTLAEHRVDVAVQDIRTGPRIIRFGLVPGWVKKYREARGAKTKHADDAMEMSRVKVQSILMREKDLALALKTPYLRLEAPVPGEALVGLEVPNPFPRTVVVRSVAESSQFQKIASKGGLPVAIGEDTGGEPIVSDLSELPHLLIAGATGSGKSVCINAIVASLLMTNRPDRLRMLMVDPKRVELTPFNGIPHLVAPVIVDSDEVLTVLRGVQSEMLRRYRLMEEIGVRNIEGYNKKAREFMPFLVIIIDELADLMMAAAYDVEQALVRLAQLGRATGIHLILATQRPSVNVVTGLLKANIPARIAFAVASQVDARVILDTVGAEKLLGKGDMLLLTADSPKPKRVQGTYVRDQEIEKLVEFWRIQTGPPLSRISLEEGDSPTGDGDRNGEDDLLGRARDLAKRLHQLSPSVLQRRLQIGYPRAMQLMEELEDEGRIGDGDPAEPAARPRRSLGSSQR